MTQDELKAEISKAETALSAGKSYKGLSGDALRSAIKLMLGNIAVPRPEGAEPSGADFSKSKNKATIKKIEL